jgi:hypothetical protein
VKGLLIAGAVVAIIVGLLFTLRSSRNAGMPRADVLERAARRAREQATRDKDD